MLPRPWDDMITNNIILVVQGSFHAYKAVQMQFQTMLFIFLEEAVLRLLKQRLPFQTF
jgi:hypothetical protein